MKSISGKKMEEIVKAVSETFASHLTIHRPPPLFFFPLVSFTASHLGS